MAKSKDKIGVIVASAAGAVLTGIIAVGIAGVSAFVSILVYKSTKEGDVSGVQVECPPCEKQYFYSDSAPLSTQSLIYQANELDLDVDEFEKCLKSDKYGAKIDADKKSGEVLGISGTPSFIIGEYSDKDTIRGFVIPGAYPFETFDKAITAIQEDGVDEAFKQMTSEIRDPLYANKYDYLLQYYQSSGEANPEGKAKAEAEAYVAELWKITEVGVGSNPPKGEEEAPVVIVEFTDYECTYCSRHTQLVLPKLESKYISKGELVYYLRDLPLTEIHPDAQNGAVATRCAEEEGKYWEMHDLLFGAE